MLVGLAVALLLLGLTLVGLGLRALRPAGALLARPTSAIRDMRAGSIEVAGVIRAADAPALSSGAGQPCVLVHTLTEVRRGKNRYEEVSRDAVAVPAQLSDETGECPISLSQVDVVGEIWERDEGNQRTTEIVIPDGASVIVSGTAVEVVDPGKGGYRQFGQSLRIEGDALHPLRIAVYGQSGAIWRLGWRALVVILCGLCVLGLAAAALWMHLRLEAVTG